jgi:hypothetical protein
VYAARNEEYVLRLIEELESEEGWMELLVDEVDEDEVLIPAAQAYASPQPQQQPERGRLVGIRCWWGIETKEQRMLLAEDAYVRRKKEDTPAIMGRIIHLRNFIKAVRLQPASEKDVVRVRLTVKDQICRENQGTFLWKIGKKESKLSTWEDGMDADVDVETEISELTQMLFGYRTYPWMKDLKVPERVFLDEVV